MEKEDKDLKSQMAARRCAKAALLLSNLKSLSPLSLQDNTEEREIQDLKIQLAKERLKNKRIKLCASGEFIVQLLLLLSLSTFFFLLFLKTHLTTL